jgi:hypothetical protein
METPSDADSPEFPTSGDSSPAVPLTIRFNAVDHIITTSALHSTAIMTSGDTHDACSELGLRVWKQSSFDPEAETTKAYELTLPQSDWQEIFVYLSQNYIWGDGCNPVSDACGYVVASLLEEIPPDKRASMEAELREMGYEKPL